MTGRLEPGELSARGAGRFEVRYKPTAKNGASAQMLTDLGFEFEPSGEGGEGLYVRALDVPFADHDVVRLKAEVAAGQALDLTQAVA